MVLNVRHALHRNGGRGEKRLEHVGKEHQGHRLMDLKMQDGSGWRRTRPGNRIPKRVIQDRVEFHALALKIVGNARRFLAGPLGPGPAACPFGNYERAGISDGTDAHGFRYHEVIKADRFGARPAPGGLLIYAVCSWLPEEGVQHRERILAAPSRYRPAAIWPAGLGTEAGATSLFRPDPRTWPGEGFQAFAFTAD